MSQNDVQLLQNIYKFDLNELLSILNLKTFTNYFHLVKDILKSNDTNDSIKQSFSDKILLLSLKSLFCNELNNETETIILKFAHLILPFLSNESFVILFKVYTFYFIKFIQTRDDLRLTLNTPDAFYKNLVQTSDIFIDLSAFDISKISMLSKLFEIIVHNEQIKYFYSNNEISDRIIYLIDLSLNALNETTDSNLLKILVTTIEKLAKINEQLKIQILDKCIINVKQTYEKLFDDNLATKKRLECFIEDSTLFLITSLADLFITESEFHSTASLNTNYQFWYLLQYGLAHTNSLTRKRALYLIKRIVDYCQVAKIHFRCVDRIDSSFIFDSNSSSWNDFFLCIELFDESSIHIIKPCLPRVDKIMNDVLNNQFHFIWLLTLIQRGFHHESKYMVRWSVAFMCKSNLENLIRNNNSIYVTDILNRFIMGPMMVTLQNAFLYYKAENLDYINKCPAIAIYLSEFINRYIYALSSNQKQIEFVEKFTSTVKNFTWNGACLLFILKCLHDMNTTLSHVLMNLETIRNLNKIVKNFNTQEILLRGGSQCYIVKTITKHLNPLNLSDDIFREIIALIHSVSSQECITYLNSTWNILIKWLDEAIQQDPKKIGLFIENEFNSFYSSSDVDEYNLKYTSIKLGKILLLLSDTNTLITEKIFISIADRLLSANRYLYMSSQKIDKCLFIFGSMINLINTSKFIDKTKKSFDIIKRIYNQIISETIDYFFRKIDDVNTNLETIEMYSKSLNDFLDFNDELNENNKIIVRKKLTQDFLSSLLINTTRKDNKKLSTEWKSFVSLNYLSALLNSKYAPSFVDGFMALKDRQELITCLLNYQIPSKPKLLLLEKDLPEILISNLTENYSLFSGKTLEVLWRVYDFFLMNIKILPNGQIDSRAILLSRFEDALDLASPYSLPSIVKALEHYQNDILSDKYLIILKNTIRCIWDIYSDVKNFSLAYEAFVNVILSKETFNKNISNLDILGFILEFIRNSTTTGKEKNGIVKPILEKLIQVLSEASSQTNEYFINVFIELIIFGEVYRKERRHIKDIEVYVEAHGESLGVNQLVHSEYQHDLGVRMCTLNYLLVSNHLNNTFYDKLINAIIQKDQEFSEGKQKLYINSLVHREKFRLWQSILILLPKFNEEQCKRILDWGDKNLITENQPSTRILIEWVFIKIILMFNHDVSQLWKKSDEFSSKKVGYCCSWMSIMCHLLPFIKNELIVEYFKNLVSVLLSRILSSNFHIRTYAEASLLKLYLICRAQTLDSKFLDNFEVKSLVNIIYSIVKPTLDDKERHANLLMTHFYFQFNPKDDYCIDTIFSTFPRLSGIIEDEFVDANTFTYLVLNKKSYEITDDDFNKVSKVVPLKSFNSGLDKCTAGVWKFTAYKEDQGTDSNFTVEDLQKKITPWHSLIPKQEELESMIKNKKVGCEEENEIGGLIVVASLIDKGSNLGGLCRTCEIFNVKEFVIGNLHYMEDKQFQSLAVTADKWLNIKEVTLKYLKQFLVEMKYNGYTLVGLEQTTNSVKLNEFSFPKKALILLGNEKEGIPVELIQLLDLCIEIPQLGVIRSLNVHVSASIAIWEYCKQHLISK